MEEPAETEDHISKTASNGFLVLNETFTLAKRVQPHWKVGLLSFIL